MNDIKEKVQLHNYNCSGSHLSTKMHEQTERQKERLTTNKISQFV
jgi:hypothetical protein